MESWLLSDKDKNMDVDMLNQNSDQLFETVAVLFKSKDEKTIVKLCSKLTSLFKDKDTKFQNLIINCIPVLLKYYFLYFYDEKICSIIEVCLLTIYNLSLSDESVKINRVRVPNLSLPSVYHLPQVSLIQSELSESALSKLESEYVISEEQFKPILDTVNAEKRTKIIRFLLMLYYSRFSGATKSSKLFFCDMCLKMCKINRQTLKSQAIYLDPNILIEMLHGLFYLFNNNYQLDAYIAIEAISVKADEELLVDVILMCNSIKNLIQQNKIEPSIQNAVNASSSSSVVYGPAAASAASSTTASGPPSSSQSGARSGSISYVEKNEKKKSRDDSSPVVSVHSASASVSKQLSQEENIPIIDDDESAGPSTSQ